MSDHLIIFDTTLRDGEQSPGASMTAQEKIRIARQLEKLRVDVIEAGFPAASVGDFEAVEMVSAEVADIRMGFTRNIEPPLHRAPHARRWMRPALMAVALLVRQRDHY